MPNRIDLHRELKRILGLECVYFQPPESIRMTYPCVVYSLNRGLQMRANDGTYLFRSCYSVTVIDQHPDSEFWRRLLDFPLCTFDRFYTADRLNHWVFTLYF